MPSAADVALGHSPKGRGVSGGLLILVTERELCEGGRPFAAARFAQPIPKRLRRNREYLCRGYLGRVGLRQHVREPHEIRDRERFAARAGIDAGGA